MKLRSVDTGSGTISERQRPGSLSLKPLSHADAQRWDMLIAPYADRQVFHSQAWLDYLAESRGLQIRKWSVHCESDIVGYFCGGAFSKGPFQVLGSPLQSWGTNSMGPLLSPQIDPRRFLDALDDLAKSERLAMVELEHPNFSPDLMAAFNYTANTLWTYRVPLEADEQAMLKRMSKARRSGIKKAIHSGLRVEQRHDLTLADDYYEQFTRIMHRKGLAPTYSREVPRLLIKHLSAIDHLIALDVRDSDGRVLATGLFPFDNGTLYFWGGASVSQRELCPNDLLHWGAMRLGAAHGLHRYDMSGWGRFKKEFGGELVTVQRWHKCYWRSAHWARRAYQYCFPKQMRLIGISRRILARE